MIRLLKLSVLALSVLLLEACSGSDSGPSPDNATRLLSFEFNSTLNDIEVNSRAIIKGSGVTIFLPVGTDRSQLVPEFSVPDGSRLLLEGEPLISGVTVVDFSERVSMRVVAEDNSSTNYNINLVTDFPGLDFDIRNTMANYNIPGMQLAIVKDEMLIYSQSYGLADVEQNLPVTPQSLFRVASVSKPVTAMAIFKLAETNQLNLDDKVFGTGAILGNIFGTKPYSDEVQQITVRHLLEHTSGWINIPYDPMFNNLGLSKSDLITDMLDNRPLSSTPGSNFHYLNFGYFLLGRVIEEVSGLRYDRYVKENILAPMKITGMDIGSNAPEDRLPDEVTYYDPTNNPYGLNLARMDANAGWLATATNLVRFLVHADRNPFVTDLVGMPFTEELYFGNDDWVFSGSLPGSSAIISRVNDDFGYALIANARTLPATEFLNALDKVIRSEIENRSDWPAYDLWVTLQ